ncbi:DUF3108 domain-containing protein [Moraxella boevrei]|uniref:DUF3108 domain-containing protein n=1 Tax=Faucicola boevrei TaxID=346665 RepID=UPI003734F70B
MNFQKTLVSTMLVVSGLVAMPAMAVISPFSANYDFNIEGKYKGSATRVLKQNGSQWTYNMNATAGKLASANMSSVFNDNGGIVIPTKSSTQYKILGVGRTEMLSFNPAQKQYISNYKGKNTTVKMLTTAYDDLSLEMQIREDLKANKFRGSYNTADRDKVETVKFTKSATTKISVPAGTFDAVRVDRVHDDKSRQTSFWLAPKLDYLPVKVVQTNDGKKMEMNLTKVN